jgi:hypothetical protein
LRDDGGGRAVDAEQIGLQAAAAGQFRERRLQALCHGVDRGFDLLIQLVDARDRDKSKLRRLALIQLVAGPFAREQRREMAAVADREISRQAQPNQRGVGLIDTDQQILQRHDGLAGVKPDEADDSRP